MADRLPPRSVALQQIYAIARARWKDWDERAGERSATDDAARRSRDDRPQARGGGRRRAASAPSGQEAVRTRRPVTLAERRLAHRLQAQGRSAREISQRLDRPLSTVRRMLRSDDGAGLGRVSRAEVRELDERVQRLEAVLAAMRTALRGFGEERDGGRRRRGQTSLGR